MFLPQSANLDQSLYHAGYPGNTHQDWQNQHLEQKYVDTSIQVANCWFGKFGHSHCHQVAQLALEMHMVLVQVSAGCIGLVEIHPFLCAFSMSADSLLCNVGKECSHPCGFHEALPGVIISQLSPSIAEETQLTTTSLFALRLEVSWKAIALSPLQCAQTLLCSLWSHSEQGACQTVLAVPDLLALPW